MPLQNKYFLSQATTSFTGALILAAVVLQNITSGGMNPFNGVSFGIVVFLLLNALALVAAACINSKRLEKIANYVISRWGTIPLVFFAYSWVLGVAKLASSNIVEWQFYVFIAIGSIVFVLQAIFFILGAWKRPAKVIPK